VDHSVESVGGPVGRVEIETLEVRDGFRSQGEWGGWLWQANGHTIEEAKQRLTTRLASLDPFEHPDWGRPGLLSGDLAVAIPENTRQLMERDYSTTRLEYQAQALFEDLFERQIARPWAYPRREDPIPPGVVIEGFSEAGGRWALLPAVYRELVAEGLLVMERTGTPVVSIRVTQGDEVRVHPERDRIGVTIRDFNDYMENKGLLSVEASAIPHQAQAITLYVLDPARLEIPGRPSE
jgi:hypothetical protein